MLLYLCTHFLQSLFSFFKKDTKSYPKGSIQNAMSDEELRAKFDSLVTPVLGAARAQEIANMVQSVENCANVGELMKLTAKQQ